MATVKALKSTPTPTSTSTSSTNSIQTISGRQSKELIIGFCGAIGSGIKPVKKAAKEELEELGYEIIDLRMSELMSLFPEYKTSTHDTNDDPAFSRYDFHQDLGDDLRGKYSQQILAEAAIKEIAVRRALMVDSEPKAQKEEDGNKKIAFFVDQLKNPSEVELFRLVYQNNFYLIGVIRSEEQRKRNLRDEGIKAKNIDLLIHRDRKSADKFGQQTEKTILDSDIFIRNNQGQVKSLQTAVKRFFSLIHGVNGITPSRQEQGMFSAHSASLQSACLSRQVGASIMDQDGNIIATGKNDVPKASGGLYSSDDGEEDYRCIHKGAKCHNDSRKLKIKSDIMQLLQKKGVVNFKEIGELIYKETGISSILEFSRSIHAEMDAITSIARTGNSKTKGADLYTTTYPCHNCARHIVAAGIKKAIYIEPYEKSLAIDLHDDAITNQSEVNKVIFEPFEGISPRRYPKFFFPSAERKNSLGEAVKITTKYSHHVDIQFLDSFHNYEDKITTDFDTKLQTT